MTMKSVPELSIIIPVYNVEKYIAAALDSLAVQDIENCEVIIVIDGSTDGSSKIVEEKKNAFSNIKVIETINQGLGLARNVGLDHAQGEFVYFFDSDDLLANEFIKDFRSWKQDYPDADLYCFSARSFIDVQNSEFQNNYVLPSYHRSYTSCYESGIDAFKSFLERNEYYPNAWLYIIRRNLLCNENLRFKKILHEDEEFTPRLLVSCSQVFVTPAVYFHRRIRTGSIMQSKISIRNVEGYLSAIAALESIKNGVGDLYLNMLLEIRIAFLLIRVNTFIKEENLLSSEDILSKIDELTNKYKTRNTRLRFLTEYWWLYKPLLIMVRKYRSVKKKFNPHRRHVQYP